MTGRTPSAAVGQPAGRGRLLMSRLWANRPQAGTVACLLAVPGAANVVLGWPVWLTAAVQWSLWLLLMVTVSIAEVRRLRSGRMSGEEADR